MNILDSVILSLVEGLTEFLPISSTAHLVLSSQLLNIAQSEFVKSFEVIVQLGAILAVVVLYFKELSRNTQLWYKTILAFLPAAVVGFFLYDFIKEQLIGNGLVTALALIIGGLTFTLADKLIPKTKDPENQMPTKQILLPNQKSQPIVYEESHLHDKHNNPRLFIPKGDQTRTSIEKLSAPRILAIGLCQSLAVIPGVSRSAASIFGGLLAGLNKAEATKFSFFLAIPTMLAASSLDLYKSDFDFSSHEVLLLIVGFIGSFITALLAVKAFIRIVQKYSFLPFGIYRIALGIFWIFYILKA